MEQGVFDKHFVGKDGFIWWIGIIASDSWKENQPGSTPDGIPLVDQIGISERYQVRIMGYHDDLDALPNDQLPWAGVVYPVTAGGGSGPFGAASSGVEAGTFVYGFFLDGENGQHPMILGILGINQYANIFKNMKGLAPFAPFLGYGIKDVVPTYQINTQSGGRIGHQGTPSSPATSTPVVGTDNVVGVAEVESGVFEVDRLVNGEIVTTRETVKPAENEIGNNQLETGSGPTSQIPLNIQEQKEKADGSTKNNIPEPYVCDSDASAGKIQQDIQNMIRDINKAQQGLKDWRRGILYPPWSQIDGKVVSIQQFISIKVQRAADAVSGWVKDRLMGAYEWIVRKITAAVGDFLHFLDPDKQKDAGAVIDTAMDLLACHFRKIVENLAGLVLKALLSIVDRYIRVPICAAENILASILGQIMGWINGAVSAIMGPINALLGAVDIVGDVLDFITDILNFLNCETNPACPKVDEYSLWDGASEHEIADPMSLINKVTSYAENVSQAVDPNNIDFEDFEFDVSGIIDNAFDKCNVDAVFCGPPEVSFWGSGGEGATGNAIISAAGDLLGVDIVNSGSGYNDDVPFISFKDACGNGQGGYGIVTIGPVSPVTTTGGTGGNAVDDFGNVIYVPDPNGTDIGVVSVEVEGGWGYLPVSDGSQGGDGWTWADSDETTVQRGPNTPEGSSTNGTWDIPYIPGDLIAVYPGDTIRTPPGSESEIAGSDGKITTVPGGSFFEVPFGGVITAPSTSSEGRGIELLKGSDGYPMTNSQYPAILSVCEAIIKNSGFGYQPTDKIIVEPANGAELEPKFNEFGQLIAVKVISGGEGVKEIPDVYIESATGYNAKITLRFCIDRIGKDEFSEPSYQDKIISIVDCVGTVPSLSGGI